MNKKPYPPLRCTICGGDPRHLCKKCYEKQAATRKRKEAK